MKKKIYIILAIIVFILAGCDVAPSEQSPSLASSSSYMPVPSASNDASDAESVPLTESNRLGILDRTSPVFNANTKLEYLDEIAHRLRLFHSVIPENWNTNEIIPIYRIALNGSSHELSEYASTALISFKHGGAIVENAENGSLIGYANFSYDKLIYMLEEFETEPFIIDDCVLISVEQDSFSGTLMIGQALLINPKSESKIVLLDATAYASLLRLQENIVYDYNDFVNLTIQNQTELGSPLLLPDTFYDGHNSVGYFKAIYRDNQSQLIYNNENAYTIADIICQYRDNSGKLLLDKSFNQFSELNSANLVDIAAAQSPKHSLVSLREDDSPQNIYQALQTDGVAVSALCKNDDVKSIGEKLFGATNYISGDGISYRYFANGDVYYLPFETASMAADYPVIISYGEDNATVTATIVLCTLYDDGNWKFDDFSNEFAVSNSAAKQILEDNIENMVQMEFVLDLANERVLSLQIQYPA